MRREPEIPKALRPAYRRASKATLAEALWRMSRAYGSDQLENSRTRNEKRFLNFLRTAGTRMRWPS